MGKGMALSYFSERSGRNVVALLSASQQGTALTMKRLKGSPRPTQSCWVNFQLSGDPPKDAKVGNLYSKGEPEAVCHRQFMHHLLFTCCSQQPIKGMANLLFWLPRGCFGCPEVIVKHLAGQNK